MISSLSEVNQATQLIREVLAGSPVPEDPGHAENTLQWLLRMQPQAHDGLRLAALAHDIERARPDRLQRHEFPDYDSFKQAHAQQGARMADALLAKAGVALETRAVVCRLIERHEVGGDRESDLLKDADSLSYFDHNLPVYYLREGYEETLKRARWGYLRLSERARVYYQEIRHADDVLNRLLKEASENRTSLAG